MAKMKKQGTFSNLPQPGLNESKSVTEKDKI